MGAEWLAYMVAAAGGIWSGIKTVSFVSEGELGVLLTFGKAARDKETGEVRILKPGFRALIPFAQRIVKIHIQKNTLWFENLMVTMGNNLTYTFDAYISYHIDHSPAKIEHVLFTLEDVVEFVGVTYRTEIQSLLWKHGDADMQTIAKKIKVNISKKLEADGILVDDCGISSFAETPVSQGLRGIDYKMDKIREHIGKMPDCVLVAAIGAMPTVGTSDCGPSQVTVTQELEE